jgi:hypothetical protein
VRCEYTTAGRYRYSTIRILSTAGDELTNDRGSAILNTFDAIACVLCSKWVRTMMIVVSQRKL